MKRDRAREILENLITEVANPDIANATAAHRAMMDAKQLFKEEGHAIQERGPEAEVPRAGEAGEDEAGSPPRVGKSNAKRGRPPRKNRTEGAETAPA